MRLKDNEKIQELIESEWITAFQESRSETPRKCESKYPK